MANDKKYDRHINIWINGKEVKNDIASIKKEMFKLTNELARTTLGSKEYNEKAAELRKVKKILADHQSSISAIGGVWQKVKGFIPIASITTLSVKVLQLTGDLFDLSKRMEADSRRSSIVFGSSLSYVEEQAARLAQKMGVTNKEFVAMAAATGDLLVPLGFSREQAAKMSVELQTLTGALDEWTGGKVGAAEISNILTKAMLGENEQLKQLGIAIRLDSDEYKDLVKEKLKIPGVTKAQAQAMAELQLIQQKSVDAQTAYNTEGNKLLRLQKSLGAGWRSLKENVVEWLKADAVDNLRAEGEMVSKLTAELYNLNTPQERRLEIYNRLKIIAPDIVKTLDDEMRATLSTRDALIEYNKQLINKIILAKKDKDIEKEREDIAKATERRLSAENTVIAAMQKAAVRMPQFAGQINAVLSDSTSVADKLLKLQQLGIDIEERISSKVGDEYVIVSTNYADQLNSAIQNEEKQLAQLNNFLDQRDELSKRLGISTAAAPGVAAPAGGGGNTLSDEEFAKGSIQRKWEPGGYDPEEWMRKEEEEIRKKALEQEEKDNEKRIKDEEKRQEAYLKSLEEGTEAAKKEWQKRRDNEREALDEMLLYYMNYAEAVGAELGKAIAEGDNLFKAAAKQMLLFLIDELAKRAKIYEAEAIIKNIATYGPIAGTIRAAAITLAIETALGAARAVVMKNLWTGGYTGSGGKYEPKGIVHGGEWVASADMVQNPRTGAIIAALENERQRTRGFADGGYVPASTSPAAGQSGQVLQLQDPRLISLMIGIERLLGKLDSEGVKTVWGYNDVHKVRKGLEKLGGIEDSVSR